MLIRMEVERIVSSEMWRNWDNLKRLASKRGYPGGYRSAGVPSVLVKAYPAMRFLATGS